MITLYAKPRIKSTKTAPTAMDKRLIDPLLNSSEHTLLCYDRPSRCLLNFLSGIFQFLQTYHFILSIVQPQMRVCVHSLHYEKFADGSVKCIEDEIPFDVPEGWSWARLYITVKMYPCSGGTDTGSPEL